MRPYREGVTWRRRQPHHRCELIIPHSPLRSSRDWLARCALETAGGTTGSFMDRGAQSPKPGTAARPGKSGRNNRESTVRHGTAHPRRSARCPLYQLPAHCSRSRRLAPVTNRTGIERAGSQIRRAGQRRWCRSPSKTRRAEAKHVRRQEDVPPEHHAWWVRRLGKIFLTASSRTPCGTAAARSPTATAWSRPTARPLRKSGTPKPRCWAARLSRSRRVFVRTVEANKCGSNAHA